MPVLRCTSKLLADIDDEPSPDKTTTPSPLGDWYGHIFTVERRKCILFINEPTLLVCLACNVVKSDYRQIGPFFIEVLTCTLRNEMFNEDEIGLILGLHKNLTVGRTLNRTTIGALNNRVANTKTLIAWNGGLENCMVGDINHLLNETPMKPIGYSNGLERMRALIGRLGK